MSKSVNAEDLKTFLNSFAEKLNTPLAELLAEEQLAKDKSVLLMLFATAFGAAMADVAVKLRGGGEHLAPLQISIVSHTLAQGFTGGFVEAVLANIVRPEA